MRIVTHRNNHYIGVGCLVCGEGFSLGDLAHDAYADDGEHLGPVCEACLSLGDQALADKLRDEADRHRAIAEGLEALACEPVRREQTEGFIEIKVGTILAVTEDDRAEAKARDHFAVESLLRDLDPSPRETVDGVHTTFVQELSLTYYTHNLLQQTRRVSCI